MGVGGRSIAEAKSHLTEKEVKTWRAYLLKYGSLNVARRLEQTMGNFFANYLSFKGAKGVEPIKFMPNESRALREFGESSERSNESIIASFIAAGATVKKII